MSKSQHETLQIEPKAFGTRSHDLFNRQGVFKFLKRYQCQSGFGDDSPIAIAIAITVVDKRIIVDRIFFEFLRNGSRYFSDDRT